MEEVPAQDISFRRLDSGEWEIIAAIASSAFGPSNHRASEIRRYLALEPNYWLLALHRGEPAAVVGATDYGPFAYLGMMTVRKDLQRRGIGGALFRREMEWLAEEGVTSLRLDATDEGYPIYAQNGFEVVDRAIMLHLPRHSPHPEFPTGIRRLDATDADALGVFDAPIFGADRTRLFRAFLADFPGRAFASRDESGRVTGFLFAQHQRLGPWVAKGPRDAEALLQAALTLSFLGPPVAVSPGCNTAALDLLHRFGFYSKRESRHMHRGTATVPGDRTSIYGLTSFAIG
jgi:predicted N-acetyltransferase YhbS